MKKATLVAFLFGLTLSGMFAFKNYSYDVRSNTAEVDQVEGVYIFTDCKPIKEYDFLGTEKVTFTMNGRYSEIRDKMVKKIRKEYPTATGVIFHLSESGGTDKADAIKFK